MELYKLKCVFFLYVRKLVDSFLENGKYGTKFGVHNKLSLFALKKFVETFHKIDFICQKSYTQYPTICTEKDCSCQGQCP